MNLTAEILRDLLHYDPETGIWTRLKSPRTDRIGKIPGTDHAGGYRAICVCGKLYLGHRLAHLYMTGEWPPEMIDHESTQKSDDRWVNLRPANNSQNKANSDADRRSKTGLRGVFRHKSGRYRAQITKNRKTISLGYFATPEEARAAYERVAPSVHGEFARI